MSFGDFVCPTQELAQPAALACPFNLFQIQKLWIYKDTGDTPFATMDAAEDAVTVTPIFAEEDDDKVISTPFIENLEIPTSEVITEAGGTNATVDGDEIVVGVNPIVVSTPMMREVTPEIVRSIKALNAITRLRAYMINEFGDVIGEEVSEGGEFRGILLTAFFAQEPQRLGKNTNDKMPFRFNLKYGWGDRLAKVRPTDYDALNDY